MLTLEQAKHEAKKKFDELAKSYSHNASDVEFQGVDKVYHFSGEIYRATYKITVMVDCNVVKFEPVTTITEVINE